MKKVLVLILLAACGDNLAVAPDAFDERFNLSCTPGGYAPLTTCQTPTNAVGWCVSATVDSGTCRRACIRGACPPGETPVLVEYGADCYCQP